MDYHILREFADSWFLIVMFSFFAVAILWVFRPGSREHYDEAADVPFKHEDRPAGSSARAVEEAR